MEVIETMNTCNESVSKRKMLSFPSKNTNRITAQPIRLSALNSTSLWPPRRVQELSKIPQLKVSEPRE